MMKGSLYVCSLIISFLLVGCNNSSNELISALKLAGENRVELEKVLNHYRDDSLKLKAAIFLIQNMPGHYSYADENIINHYNSEIDTVLTNSTITSEEKLKIVEQATFKYRISDKNTVEDITIIKADFLIYHINQAFKHWTENRILKHITFEQFCEYLLPYKVTEFQQMDYWRDSLRSKYSKQYYSTPVPSRLQFSICHASNAINAEINSRFPQVSLTGNYYPFLSASNIDKMPFGLCGDYTILATAILRSEGIPVIVEELPQWGTKMLGHSWYSIINTDGNIFPYYWGLHVNAGARFFVDEPVPKVYRHTYSRNDRPLHYLMNCKNSPLDVSIFKKDITSEYIATSKLSIPINKKFAKAKWAYIAVFDNEKWVLVDYGQIVKGKAIFENMGRNIAYLVFGYDGIRLFSISEAFILHTNGEIEYLKSDKNNLRTISLTRKYPMTEHTLLMEQRLVGGKIEAAETSDFANKIIFHELKTGDQREFIPTNTEGKYRYWRYISPWDAYGNIAELEFYEKGSQVPAKGEFIGTQYPYEGNEQWSCDKAFDGDWLSYAASVMANYAWIGIDFKKPVNIEKFRCIPRSDDNNIRTGDEYELFYWNNDKWNSLGRKVGETSVMVFDNVPDNSLLLLRNHTRGKEERIFTYENGKQIWW